MHNPRPFLSGMAVGLDQLIGLDFDQAKPHTFCRICGAIYQSDLDRRDHYLAVKLRQDWSHRHAGTHTTTEHNQLLLSGRFLTPEAQIVLAAFGIISITLDDEIEQALFESRPVPTNDSEG